MLLLLLLTQLFTVSVPAELEAEARGLVTDMAPGARLTYSVGGTLKYELPADQVGTTDLSQALAACHFVPTHILQLPGSGIPSRRSFLAGLVPVSAVKS
jgi:hypothetical protein